MARPSIYVVVVCGWGLYVFRFAVIFRVLNDFHVELPKIA